MTESEAGVGRADTRAKGPSPLERLQRVARRVATGCDRHRKVVQAAVEIVGSDAASIQVYDHDRRGLRLVGWHGFDPASAAFWRLVAPESASTCGLALTAGTRVVVPDVEAAAALAGSDDLHEYRRSGLRAVQPTPLFTGDGRVVGMLSTHWRSPHEVRAEELRRIDLLQGGTRAAIEAARLGQKERDRPPPVLPEMVNGHPRHQHRKAWGRVPRHRWFNEAVLRLRTR